MELRRSLPLASLGMLTRVALQACTLLLTTRIFSAADYGALSALVAATGILFPVIGLGLDAILVREVSRQPAHLPRYWGQSLIAILASGLPISVVLALTGPWLLPGVLSAPVILMVALADLVFGRLLDNNSRVYLAMGRSVLAAWLPSLLALLRLAAIAALYVARDGRPTLQEWALAYTLAALLPALVSQATIMRCYGRPEWRTAGWLGSIRAGMPFLLNATADRANSDADKVLMASLARLEVAGAYGLAYRCFNLAFVPVTALLNATYPQFFVHGQRGTDAARRYAVSLLKWALPASLLVSVATLAGSFAVVPVFGEDYRDSVTILAWLAPLAPVLLLRYSASYVLGGSGGEQERMLATVAATTLNILLNLRLIPELGWQGAIIATVASELALGLLLVALIVRRRHPPTGDAHA